jgi:FkbM family methyltransferase
MPKRLWKIVKNARRASEIFLCARETRQWLQITTAYLGFSRLRYPYVLQLRLGDLIRLEEATDLRTFWQIFLRRVYPVRPTDLVVLDVGANIGLFTLYAARRAPKARILSLEPFPTTFARLLTNVRDHHLDSRVVCLNYALTGVRGLRVMRDASVPSQRRSLESTESVASGTQVLGKTLQEMMDENDLRQVDLLKMDIEGSEYEVLLSAPPSVLARISRIALEYHGDSAPYSKQQILDHLGQGGFALTRDVCDELGYGVAEMVLNSQSL